MTLSSITMRDMELLNKEIKSYLKYVWEQEKDYIMGLKFGENYTYNTLDEYLEDKFKFDALNDWKTGYDFYEWCEFNYNNLRYSTHYKLISYIVNYYESNFGDLGSFNMKDLSIGYVLNHYAYVKGSEMSIDELKKIFEIKDDDE
jgi:hypothetical protein